MFCLSSPPRPQAVRKAASRADVLVDMVATALEAKAKRGDVTERDFEQAGFTAAEVAAHRETVMARLRREAGRRRPASIGHAA